MEEVPRDCFSCRDCRRWSDAYVDRELDRDIGGLLVSHIGVCLACRRLVGEKAHLKSCLRRSVATDATGPDDLWERIRQILKLQ